MASVPLPPLFVRLAGIALSGGLGALGGWWMTAALELSGLAAALLAVAIGMTLATGIFAGWTRLAQMLSRR